MWALDGGFLGLEGEEDSWVYMEGNRGLGGREG